MIFPGHVFVHIQSKEFCQLFWAIISYLWKCCIANMHRILWNIMPAVFRTYDNIFCFVCIKWKSVCTEPIKYSNGPSIEPWGTPILMGTFWDITPFISTNCVLSEIVFKPIICYAANTIFFHFVQENFMVYYTNAFDRSHNTANVCSGSDLNYVAAQWLS